MKQTHPLMIVLLLLPGIGVIMCFIGAVMYMAVAQSFGLFNLSGDSAFSLDFWSKMLGRQSYWNAISYSLYIGFVSAILSTLLAYPIAIWLRKPFYGSMAVSAMLKAPMLVHGIVAAFLFLNIVAYHGILNQLMMGMGIWDEPRRIQGDPNAFSVLFLQVWKNMPFALLIITGSVQSVSDDVLNAARDLGAGVFARFRKVILPLTLSALQAAMILIFIGAAADFTFQTIVGPTNVNSLSQYMTRFKAMGKWNDAAVIAVTMMLLSLLGAIVIALFTQLITKSRIAK